jgi:hypothetical protein
MRFRLPNSLLSVAAVVTFVAVPYAPKDSDPGPWLTAVWGILLLRRAIITVPQPVVVILSGCFLTALTLAGDHGLININRPMWIGTMLVGFISYGLWERIEKLWKS